MAIPWTTHRKYPDAKKNFLICWTLTFIKLNINIVQCEKYKLQQSESFFQLKCFVTVALFVQGVSVQGVYVLYVLGGKCPGGKCLGGICHWGK